jgi:hypothetical protein
MGSGEDEGEELITNVQCPNSQCPILRLLSTSFKASRSVQVPNAPYPIPYSPLYDALIIGKKRGKLLTASIIEFDLLFNAHAYK